MPYEASPPGASGSAANGTVQVCNSLDLAQNCDSSDFVIKIQGRVQIIFVSLLDAFLVPVTYFFFERRKERDLVGDIPLSFQNGVVAHKLLTARGFLTALPTKARSELSGRMHVLKPLLTTINCYIPVPMNVFWLCLISYSRHNHGKSPDLNHSALNKSNTSGYYVSHNIISFNIRHILDNDPEV